VDSQEVNVLGTFRNRYATRDKVPAKVVAHEARQNQIVGRVSTAGNQMVKLRGLECLEVEEHVLATVNAAMPIALENVREQTGHVKYLTLSISGGAQRRPLHAVVGMRLHSP
jgi:hypothetical protein